MFGRNFIIFYGCWLQILFVTLRYISRQSTLLVHPFTLLHGFRSGNNFIILIQFKAFLQLVERARSSERSTWRSQLLMSLPPLLPPCCLRRSRFTLYNSCLCQADSLSACLTRQSFSFSTKQLA